LIPAVVISKKRDGEKLTEPEIKTFISLYAEGKLPDYQMAALAMAIFLRGMDAEETSQLTDAMIATGDTLRRVGDRQRVDKHSTGGLGDKTSLILAPLLACCDLDVPMISGRGLGITGGTLDKLEAIPGFRCDLSETESETQLKKLGCFITGATDRLVPADKKLYALRDVTGTVPSIPLITASIMSKKIAETLDALVLDVKFGSGAFLPTLDRARELAKSLCSNGLRAGIKTVALLTDMNQPLGAMVGNACEVDESLETLKGQGPADVMELTLELCARVLVSTGKAIDAPAAREILRGHLQSGRAMERFEAMVHMQGGKLHAPRPLGKWEEIKARSSGVLNGIDGQKLGQAIIAMGGGRKQAGERIDPSVGIKMEKRVGEPVRNDETLLVVYCDSELKREDAKALIYEAIRIEESVAERFPLWQEFQTEA
jgi:pyrimidine-nucleoside phosphorylase